MNRRRMVPAITLVAMVLAVALPTLAQESPEEPAEIVPAVVVEESIPAEPVPDWTYRYLVPTSLALALIFCVITVVLYFTRVVKSRYKSVG